MREKLKLCAGETDEEIKMGHIPYDNRLQRGALKNYFLCQGALWKHREEIMGCLDERISRRAF